MRKNDLLTLADYLQTVPRQAFNMKHWSLVIKNKVLGREHVQHNYECGMSACIGGHAALVFPHRLKLSAGEWGDDTGDLSTVRRDKFDNYRYGDVAFAHAFDLCQVCATKLTSNRAPHTTPKRAAQALRKLVRGRTFIPHDECGVPDECHFGIRNCRPIA